MGYIIYPQAKALLDRAGIARALDARRDDWPDNGPFSFGLDSEDIRSVFSLKDLSSGNLRSIDRILSAYEDASSWGDWLVEQDTGQLELPLPLPANPFLLPYAKRRVQFSSLDPLTDCAALAGVVAYELLPKRVFRGAQEAGFPDDVSFWSAIAAYVTPPRDLELPSFDSRRTDGTLFQFFAGGSMHGDFISFQRELTPYRTLAPTARPVPIRPYDLLEQRISLFHSSEPLVVGCLVRAAEVAGISLLAHSEAGRSELVRRYAQGAQLGNFGDAGMADVPRWLFAEDLPGRIDESGAIVSRSTLEFSNQTTRYKLYLDERTRGLAVLRHDGDSVETALSLFPDEVEPYIGLVFAAARKGMVRSSVKNILDALQPE